MNISFKRWQDMPNGRERYQVYLASREWALLKEAVKARSGGTCEHCKASPGTQTHHMTYERQYDEFLTDLLHVCGPCHEFLSGKAKRNPRLDAPVMLLGRKITSVYLAGKITGTTWRDEICPAWSEEQGSRGSKYYTAQPWDKTPKAIAIGDGRFLDYTGPFWRQCDWSGGHGTSTENIGPHAAGSMKAYLDNHGEHGSFVEHPNCESISEHIVSAISESDLLFAWIDSNDCFGTLVEIGMSKGFFNKTVICVAHGFNYSDLWLSLKMADVVYLASSPGEGWKSFLKTQGIMLPQVSS